MIYEDHMAIVKNQFAQHLQKGSSTFSFIGRGGRFLPILFASLSLIICFVKFSKSSFTFSAVLALV